MDPGAGRENVLFALPIVDPGGLRILVVGHLVIVEPESGVEPKLVLWIAVVNQRREAAAALRLIVQVDAGGRFQAPVRVVAAGTHVIGKLRCVIAKTQPVVSLVIVSVTEDQLCLLIAFKARIRRNVKHTIGAVTVFSRIAAAFS